MKEYLDIVDADGNPTGQITDRETAHLKGIRHRTAHVWILREKNGIIQILLQKRCAAKSSYPGCYDISSAGHIPAGVDFIPSALRELQEEMGITAEPDELILCGKRVICADEVFFGKEFHDRQVSNIYILWRDTDESEFRLQPEEVEAVKWMDFDKCLENVRNNTIPHCIVTEELLLIKNSIRR